MRVSAHRTLGHRRRASGRDSELQAIEHGLDRPIMEGTYRRGPSPNHAAVQIALEHMAHTCAASLALERQRVPPSKGAREDVGFPPLAVPTT